MLSVVKRRWSEDSGYREVLAISVPLILSTGAWSILLFFDILNYIGGGLAIAGIGVLFVLLILHVVKAAETTIENGVEVTRGTTETYEIGPPKSNLPVVKPKIKKVRKSSS